VASKLRLDRAPAPVLIEGDARVQALQGVSTQPETPEEYVDAIARLWSRAQTAFLDIGRLLIRAKETLPHGEYTTAVEERLPFAARTAYQLREAARWALEMDRRQTITLDALPGSYSTIYLLSTLDPPTLEQARKEGLVRPELRRSELIAWRRNRTGQGHQSLQERREKLLRERARLDEELRRIEAELAE
jgi:hypothetical protein